MTEYERREIVTAIRLLGIAFGGARQVQPADIGYCLAGQATAGNIVRAGTVNELCKLGLSVIEDEAGEVWGSDGKDLALFLAESAFRARVANADSLPFVG